MSNSTDRLTTNFCRLLLRLKRSGLTPAEVRKVLVDKGDIDAILFMLDVFEDLLENIQTD
jgi:hypothetical protein